MDQVSVAWTILTEALTVTGIRRQRPLKPVPKHHTSFQGVFPTVSGGEPTFPPLGIAVCMLLPLSLSTEVPQLLFNNLSVPLNAVLSRFGPDFAPPDRKIMRALVLYFMLWIQAGSNEGQ